MLYDLYRQRRATWSSTVGYLKTRNGGKVIRDRIVLSTYKNILERPQRIVPHSRFGEEERESRQCATGKVLPSDMPTACRSARHHPFTRPIEHADTFWLYKHQTMRQNSSCVAGSAWHRARLGQDSAAQFTARLVHAVTKLWLMERIDSACFGYKRGTRLFGHLYTRSSHIPT